MKVRLRNKFFINGQMYDKGIVDIPDHLFTENFLLPTSAEIVDEKAAEEWEARKKAKAAVKEIQVPFSTLSTPKPKSFKQAMKEIASDE